MTIEMWFLEKTFLLFVLSLAVTTSPAVVFAQTNDVAIPINATPNAYGSGWQCDVGYVETNAACTVIVVPGNAYETGMPFGQGWKCNKPFLQHDNTCVIN